MNFYLLGVISRWIGFTFLSLAMTFGYQTNQQNYEIDNINSNKNVNIVNDVVDYQTIIKYDASIPSNISKVEVIGQDGLNYYNNSGELVNYQSKTDEIVVKGTGAYGIFKGITTGYGPDCKTCSGVGNVSCKTREKTKFNLINDGIYYNDVEFGETRILAAALSVFPCGTIVEVNSPTMGVFMGIVMDTGAGMKKSLENGVYHFDVAFQTEKDEEVHIATNMNGSTIFSVQRWGW